MIVRRSLCHEKLGSNPGQGSKGINLSGWHGLDCGTLKCENAAICEKVAKCEKYSTLNVKIDAICEKITLNVKK